VLRTNDTCARLGGEEFLVICPGTPMDGARQLAERVRAAIEGNHIQLPNYQGHITVSLGIGCRSSSVDSIDALLKTADEAVYQAKRLGRNRVVASAAGEERSQRA